MYKINTILLLIVKIPVSILSVFTSLISGLLSTITFGISGPILHSIKYLLFSLPVIHISKLHQNFGIIGKVFSIIGLPFTILGMIYSMLVGHGGDQPLRAYDLTLFETFPYSNDFDDYVKSKVDFEDISHDSRQAILNVLQDPIFEDLIGQYKTNYFSKLNN